MLFMLCDCHAFAFIYCSLVVTCWERADLFALVWDVHRDFVTFPLRISGQLWYLIVSIHDPCSFSYFYMLKLRPRG